MYRIGIIYDIFTKIMTTSELGLIFLSVFLYFLLALYRHDYMKKMILIADRLHQHYQSMENTDFFITAYVCNSGKWLEKYQIVINIYLHDDYPAKKGYSIKSPEFFCKHSIQKFADKYMRYSGNELYKLGYNNYITNTLNTLEGR